VGKWGLRVGNWEPGVTDGASFEWSSVGELDDRLFVASRLKDHEVATLLLSCRGNDQAVMIEPLDGAVDGTFKRKIASGARGRDRIVPV
jgi:hypothetical protein